MATKKWAATLTALAAIALAAWPARADYPAQPIRIVVPFAAGGFVDSLGRIFADKLGSLLKMPVIIENRSGGGGKIGEEVVGRAAPDGYTLLAASATRPTLLQAVTPGVPEIDVLKTFEIAGVLGTTPITLNASPKLGVADFKSLIERVKAEPGKHSYGSPGPGTPSHIFSAMIARLFDLKVVHVPFRGGGQVLGAVAAGDIAWSADTPTSSLPFIRGKKVVPILITSASRVKQLPEVRTAAELGHPQFTGAGMTIFLMAPAGTPKPVLERLNAAVAEAHKDATVQARLDTLALVAPPPDASLAMVRDIAAQEISSWAEAISIIGQP
jgi:tripartite-type tricarboxylate transporter receptor subunit TctC